MALRKAEVSRHFDSVIVALPRGFGSLHCNGFSSSAAGIRILAVTWVSGSRQGGFRLAPEYGVQLDYLVLFLVGYSGAADSAAQEWTKEVRLRQAG